MVIPKYQTTRINHKINAHTIIRMIILIINTKISVISNKTNNKTHPITNRVIIIVTNVITLVITRVLSQHREIMLGKTLKMNKTSANNKIVILFKARSFLG